MTRRTPVTNHETKHLLNKTTARGPGRAATTPTLGTPPWCTATCSMHGKRVGRGRGRAPGKPPAHPLSRGQPHQLGVLVEVGSGNGGGPLMGLWPWGRRGRAGWVGGRAPWVAGCAWRLWSCLCNHLQRTGSRWGVGWGNLKGRPCNAAAGQLGFVLELVVSSHTPWTLAPTALLPLPGPGRHTPATHLGATSRGCRMGGRGWAGLGEGRRGGLGHVDDDHDDKFETFHTKTGTSPGRLGRARALRRTAHLLAPTQTKPCMLLAGAGRVGGRAAAGNRGPPRRAGPQSTGSTGRQ